MDKVVTSRHRPERNRERKKMWNEIMRSALRVLLCTAHSLWVKESDLKFKTLSVFSWVKRVKKSKTQLFDSNPSFRTLSFQLRIWHEKLCCRFFHSWKNTTKQQLSMRSKVFRISQQKNVLQCKIINSDQTLILFPDQTLQL